MSFKNCILCENCWDLKKFFNRTFYAKKNTLWLDRKKIIRRSIVEVPGY